MSKCVFVLHLCVCVCVLIVRGAQAGEVCQAKSFLVVLCVCVCVRSFSPRVDRRRQPGGQAGHKGALGGRPLFSFFPFQTATGFPEWIGGGQVEEPRVST